MNVMFVIEINFCDGGCGWGYGNYRNKNDERVVYDLLFLFSFVHSFCVRFFWGYFGVGSGTHYMYSL